ncbi:hypothetical protein CDD82_5864 [Ophiocordyceps australis]|uniref:Peroxisomal adenine nucleotide transporter 1 n=1 Tax=Ophiocordyceps australis TaxID=1399860 RepID=A0A2C5XHJ9_9HYPO|nr:hypothetical protein CDD82_5864 [Ophiocordyceps australis]
MSPSNAALEALGHAISGAAGTAVSTAAVYPLDLVTTRLKTQPGQRPYKGVFDALASIVKQDGISALYKGLGPDVAKSVVDSFLFFGFYSYLRSRNRHPSVVRELLMGALAGAGSRALTTPISNVVARMQLSSRTQTLCQTLVDIYNQSGLAGLWAGYSATIVLALSPSITFFINRRLAKRILPALEEEDVPIASIAFLLAAFSKATATALMYPFQTAKIRLMISQGDSLDNPCAMPENEKPKRRASLLHNLLDSLSHGIFDVVLRIIHQEEEGICALYHGLQGELLKGFFSHGLTMLTKGLLHRLVIRLYILAKSRELRGGKLHIK